MNDKMFPDHMSEKERVADIIHVSKVVSKARKFAVELGYGDDEIVEATAKIAEKMLGYDVRERFDLHPNKRGSHE